MPDEIVVDARGHRCPVPSLKLSKAMSLAPAGQVFELLATDPMARIDVPFLMQDTGGQVLAIEDREGDLLIRVQSGGATPD